MSRRVLLMTILLGLVTVCCTDTDGTANENLASSSGDAKEAKSVDPIGQESGNGTSAQDVSAAPNLSNTTKPKFTHVRFDDDWPAKYPQCSPEKNKYLSPVSINTKKAIEIGHSVRTLLLYSFEPIKNYTLQTWYNDTENKLTMSALTITLDDTIFFEAAYINGLGFEDFKLFQRAVFLTSRTGLRPEQSLHQLNGKTYPMEIMLTFTNRKADNNSVKSTTQVFVLVEIQEYDNPNFFPVIEAAKQILKMQNRADMIKNLTATLDLLTKNLTTVTEAYTSSGKGGDADKLKSLIPGIEHAVSQMKLNEKYKEGLEQRQKVINEDLERHHYLTDFKNISAEYAGRMKNYSKVLEARKADPNNLGLFHQKQDLELNLVRDRGLFGSLGRLVGSLTYQLADSKLTIARLGAESSRHKAFIENITSQIEGDQKPANETMLLAFIKTQIARKAQMKQLQGKVNATKADLAKTEKALGWKQRLATFQITWLLPDRGGIYVYNGSSPLPPCDRFRYSVLLQNPVGISQEQYDTLTKIPAYEGYQAVGEQVVPRLAELGPRLVWHNAKNIQWQRDDGIHMKSIVRRKWKQEMRAAAKVKMAAAHH